MENKNRMRRLEQQLAEYDAVTNTAERYKKIDLLNGFAWELSDTDTKRAYNLSEEAFSMAESSEESSPPYRAGMAYSLRTLGYLNQRLGNYTLGLTQLLSALEIFETLPLEEGLADVYDGIAGIYGQIGDFPEALTNIQNQLEAAQRIGDKRRIANAYNNLANIYFETGDYDKGIELFRENLKNAAEIGDQRIICLSYLNLAETNFRVGNYDSALEYGLSGLPVCQKSGFELFEIYAFDFLGKIQLKLGNTEQAIQYHEKALALSEKLGSEVTESLILINVGQAYLEMQQPDRALSYLQRGITTAESIDARSELFRGHLLLSKLYEKQGDFSQALDHFKQYQTIKDMVFNEKADQRLKVLEVVHDTEAARKEAEILRLETQQLEHEITEQMKVEAVLQEARDKLEQQVQLRTAELDNTITLLQNEIADRLRAEAAIQHMVETLEQRVATRTEELVTFFDLILLAGQATTPIDVIEHALPRILEVTRSQAVGIDVIDADRNTLQLVAHLNFPRDAQTPLQIEDLPVEIQRWLHQTNDPLNIQDLESIPALLSAFHTAGFQTYLGAQIRIGHRVEGVLSCFRLTDRGYSVDDIALVMALAEQIGMMLENHRLRQRAEEMAVLEERQRLARDLHDSVTQSLYSLSLFSRAGREAAEDGDVDRLKFSLKELEQNTQLALHEMRLLLYELRPADLEQGGLIPAIEMRLNSVERRVGLQLEVQLDKSLDLPQSDEVELYRIIVEALNNVVKHAAATHLTLQLTQANGWLNLRISDNGMGFDPARTEGGMGLQNIRERIARLDGRLSISSKPGSGTNLEAVIPYRVEDNR